MTRVMRSPDRIAWQSRDMGYRELLPQVDTVTDVMVQAGLTPEQARVVLAAVGTLLLEHSQFHHYEYERVGERQDIGARDVLKELGEDFRTEATAWSD